MKPLSQKPPDACGKTPVTGFTYQDASGATLGIGAEINKYAASMTQGAYPLEILLLGRAGEILGRYPAE